MKQVTFKVTMRLKDADAGSPDVIAKIGRALHAAAINVDDAIYIGDLETNCVSTKDAPLDDDPPD